MLKLGECFAGYGGLGMAVEEVFGAELAWVSEWEAAPSKILAHHWPDVPNYGDVTKIDWYGVETVDIISGGSPCQDLSLAGKRRGMADGTRSNLWESMREGIATIRPRYVVWENVRGALSAGAISEMEQSSGRLGADGNPNLRAIGRVLGDLADLGFDAEWRGVRAADVGASHGRFRVFILARNAEMRRRDAAQPAEWSGQCEGAAGGPNLKTTADADNPGRGEQWRPVAVQAEQPAAEHLSYDIWGDYAGAIQRWESTLGRRAPAPTEPGRNGARRLNPEFAEWMMGLPSGWVTDVPGVTRNDAIRACGNGVVPQQAMAALRDMLASFRSEAA